MTSFEAARVRCEVGAAVAAAIVWTLTRTLGQRLPSRWRYALWLVVLGRLCLPTLPGVPVHVPFPASRTPTALPAVPRLPPVDVQAAAPVEPVRVVEPAALPAAVAPTPVERPPFDPTPWLLRTWATVAAVLFARLVARTVRLHRQIHSYPPLTDDRLLAELAVICRSAGMRRPPPAVVSPAGTGPAIAGLFRPRLLLPADFAVALPPAARRLVLMHELARLRRRDVPVGWVAAAVAAVHWFNPAAWLALRQLRLERELAADAAVLDATGDRATYGETLVRLVRTTLAPAPAGSSAMADPARALSKRIAMIARHRLTGRRHAAAAVVACVAVAAAATLWADPTPPGPASRPAPAEFNYAGRVVDDHDHGIAGVRVSATYRLLDGTGFGNIDDVTTDAAGRFAVRRADALSGASAAAVVDDPVRIEFFHADFATGRMEDLRLLTTDQATHLHVVLRTGRTVVGRVVGPDGKPVAGAQVAATLGSVYDQRRGTTTDVDGRLSLAGLPPEPGTLAVLTVDRAVPLLTAHRDLGKAEADVGDLPAVAVAVPTGPAVPTLFGMKLVDVDPASQAAFHLPRPAGVLVLDAGPSPARLGLGDVRRGDTFWVVGTDPVGTFADFRRRLLAAVAADPAAAAGYRVVSEFARPEYAGNSTQYLRITAADVAELKASDPGPTTRP